MALAAMSPHVCMCTCTIIYIYVYIYNVYTRTASPGQMRQAQRHNGVLSRRGSILLRRPAGRAECMLRSVPKVFPCRGVTSVSNPAGTCMQRRCTSLQGLPCKPCDGCHKPLRATAGALMRF